MFALEKRPRNSSAGKLAIKGRLVEILFDGYFFIVKVSGINLGEKYNTKEEAKKAIRCFLGRL